MILSLKSSFPTLAESKKMKTPKRRQGRRSGDFTANSEHISHLSQLFLLLILNKLMLVGINWLLRAQSEQ